ISRSPQKGGFHRCTGGKPFLCALVLAACCAAAVSPSRRWTGSCPCFAMVCREFQRLSVNAPLGAWVWHNWCKQAFIKRPYQYGFRLKYHGSGRHIVMPFIPRNADNVGIVYFNKYMTFLMSLAWAWWHDENIGGGSNRV